MFRRIFRTSKTQDEIRLVAIGNSIIRGTADTEKGGWVERSVTRLHKTYPKLSLIKKGVGGDTTKKVLDRIYPDCIDLKPDLVIVGVGVNDSRRRKSLGNVTEISEKNFHRNLKQIISIINKKSKAKIILSGMVPVDERAGSYKPDKTHHRKDQIQFEKIIKKISKKHKLLYLNFFDEWLSYGEDTITALLDDGLHPTSEGHEQMAEYAYPILQNFFSRHLMKSK